MKTTLNEIRKHHPCSDGWTKLLKHLGKTKADDEPLAILTILEANGLDDAIWCLRAVPETDRLPRLFAAWCARQVQCYTDSRFSDLLDAVERYAQGFSFEAVEAELKKAQRPTFAWPDARDDYPAYYANLAAYSAASAALCYAETAAGYAVSAVSFTVLRQDPTMQRVEAWATRAAARSAQKEYLTQLCKVFHEN